MDNDLISKSALLKEIDDNYDCNYGEVLINPRHFYDLVDDQPTVETKSDWISTKDKLPEDDARYSGRHKIDVIVETNKGLITKVQRIHRRNYDGIYVDWYWGRIYGNVIAWQPMPERYKEADERRLSSKEVKVNNGEVPILEEDRSELIELISKVNKILDKYDYSSDYSSHMASAMSRAKNYSKYAKEWIGYLHTEEELKERYKRGY